MSGITLLQAQSKLTLWMEVDDAVAHGKSYTIGDRSLTRANKKEIRGNIEFWDKQIKRLTSGGIYVRGSLRAMVK